MNHHSFSCQGESHKYSDKPCQDSSYSYSGNGISIAIVCDGHGGERYFRSDIGSQICIKVTENAIRTFVNSIDKNMFKDKPFTQKRCLNELNSFEKLNEIDSALRHLFASIILAWNNEVEKYTSLNPPTEEELNKVSPKHLAALTKRESLEKIYGCTLMAYVQTPEYWFAFHIGDGKCISFHDSQNCLWQEPIPWDDKCFLNKTTSICDSEAIDEFRYCYQGNGEFPVAVFLGSDGMDDSFGPIENLVDFYMQIAKLLSTGNNADAIQSIEETLPILSKRGSQDDMSIAYIYDLEKLQTLLPLIIKNQIENIEKEISGTNQKIIELQDIIDKIADSIEPKSVIEKNYAIKDLEKNNAILEKLNNKVNLRRKELETLVQSNNE